MQAIKEPMYIYLKWFQKSNTTNFHFQKSLITCLVLDIMPKRVLSMHAGSHFLFMLISKLLCKYDLSKMLP